MNPMDLMADHGSFVVTLLYYFIPAFTGAALSTYIKYIKSHSKKTNDDGLTPTRRVLRTILLMFFSALVPSILLASFHGYFSSLVEISSLRIGISFIFGCIGDETLDIITSLQKMLTIMRALSKYIESLKQASQISDAVNDELNKESEKEKEKDDSDDSTNPPNDSLPPGDSSSSNPNLYPVSEDDEYLE